MNYLDPSCPWSGYELGQLISCEERLCSWIRQPMNTFSNLGLFATAVLLFWAWKKNEKKKSETASGKIYRDFAFLAALIGISSMLSHASQIRALIFLDYASQFLLLTYLSVLNFRRVFKERKIFQASSYQWVMTGVLTLVFITPSLIDKRAGVPMFVLLATLYLVTEAMSFKKSPAPTYGALKKSLAIFAVASVCFGMDAKRIGCVPEQHFFQLHSVWHVLVAASLYLLALHCRQFETEFT